MYLVVKFYDNDFGTPMLRALERLWDYIHDNNAHTAGPHPAGWAPGSRNGLTLPQIYQKLHECGALESMILRLFVLEQLCQGVEHKTRDLTWTDFNWESHIIKDPSNTIGDFYLSVTAAIYGEYEAILDIEWANGECAYLNLDNGTVGIF